MRHLFRYLFLSSFFAFLVVQANVERMDPGPFDGFWEIQEPAGDTFVVIVKRGGDISGFWAGSGTTRIQKGQWEREGNRLVAEWETGHHDILEITSENVIRRKGFDPGESITGSPTLTGRGAKVDPQRPGSMAVDRDPSQRGRQELGPDEDPHGAPAIPLRNAFTGFWRVRGGSGIMGGGSEFYLQLQRNGRAITAMRGRGDDFVNGRWRIDNERVIVQWPDGSRDIIRDEGDGDYRLLYYRSRDVASGRPRFSRRAEKIPAAEAMRYFQIGEHQMLTASDMRGIWHIEDAEGDEKSFIEIEGWGNAFRYNVSRTSRSESGNWRLLSDRIVINWIDGGRDIIRLTDSGFMLESYADREDEEPTRVTSSISRSSAGSSGASMAN
ncbi:MAG: hypothetical protein JJU20_08900 [Opitutales bacterium]|nr:hypothetical protein [Opitutales bacterium]